MALVTGAANGIGLAIVKALLKSGAKVGLLDIAGDALTKTCEGLKEEGYGVDRVLGVQCDVANKDELIKAFHKVRDEFGYIDTVVNNAGIASEKNLEKLLQINLHAVIVGTTEAVQMMSTSKGGKGGVVINTASIAGITGQCGIPIYTASKAGVVGYTRAMGLVKFTDGVRVNCICPFITDTPMLKPEDMESALIKTGMPKQAEKLLSPEYVAKGVMKLITDETLYGQVLRVHPVDGYTVHDYQDSALGVTVEEMWMYMNTSTTTNSQL